MPCRIGQVHDVGDDEGYRASEEYLLVHAEVIGHGASDKNACANADVPAAEVCAVGRASLVVAGEVHAHGLVAGEDKPEACADEECGQEKRNGAVAKGEDEVGDDDQRHAGTHKMNQVTAVN